MVRAPEYEEMDRARVDAVPNAFKEIFGDDGEYTLKEIPPNPYDERRCGPIERSTFHIYRGKTRVAEIYQGGHIEILDESIKDKLMLVSQILEKEAEDAYRMVKEGY